MKGKKYVLFDLDGTITDSSEGIINSIRYSLKKFGIDEYDTAKLYKFIGPPLVDSFVKYYGFEKAKATEAVRYYREYYSQKGIFENRLYSGIKELLKVLNKSGKKVILATSKPEKFAKEILGYFDIEKYFYFVGGATMDEKRSEKEEVLEYILKQCKINPNDAVMIGDRKYDIKGAHAFGIEAVGVLFGFGNLEELKNAEADHIVADTQELAKILI